MKKTCTVIALALALALLVSFAVLSSGAASESSKWDGSSVSTSLQTDPSGAYLIQSAADMAYFVKSVNDQGNFYVGKTVKLTTDIVWNEGDASSWKKDTTGLNAWTPIGPWGKHFQGIFDGQGHTVSGLFFSGAGNAGFFGVLWGGATTVKNLNVVNSAFFSTGTNVGGIAGVVRGNKTVIENIYVDAYVEGPDNVGSIVGTLWNNENGNLTVKNCVANGTVKSTGNYGGGIVGMQGSGTTVLTISDCLNLATVTANSYAGGINGGFTWTARGQTLTVTDCIGLGLVADIRTDADTDGAIFGNYADNPTLTNLLFATDSEQGPAGGKTTLAGCTGNTAAAINAMFTADLAEAGFENWIRTEEGVLPKTVAAQLGLSEKLPAPAFDGDVWDGTSVSTSLRSEGDNVYIDSAADLAYFAKSVNDGNNYAGKTVKLTKNIRWNDISNIDSWTASTTGLNAWTAIGVWNKEFLGTFDGQGFTVDGLYATNAGNNFGFFGCLKNGTVVKNLKVENSKFFVTQNNAGGMLGILREGSVTFDNVYCDIDIAVTGAAVTYVGGFVGFLHGNGNNATNAHYLIFKNCVYAGEFTSVNNYCGGFIGAFQAKENNTDGYYWNVSFTDCLFNGSILGKAAIGGFIGSHPAGIQADSLTLTMTDCMSLGTVGMQPGGWNVGNVSANMSLVSPNTLVTNLWFVDSRNSNAPFGTLKTNDGTDLAQTKVTATEVTLADANAKTTEALATAGFENWGLTAEGVLPKAVAEMLGLEIIVEKPAGSDTSSDSSTNTESDTSDTSDTTDASTDTGSSDTTDTEKLPANPVVKPNISDASVYDGTKSTTLRTEGKNVYIDSAADLAYFASRVTSGDGYAGKTVILTTDIVWNKGDADSWTATSTGLNVWSCGAWNKFFRGTFDGQGHTVSGLYQVSDKDNIGFINGVGGTCEIKNLVIVNSAFFCTRDGSSANLGGVVGVMGEATKLKIDNVYCDANLIAPKAIQVGGIIGRVHNGLCTVDITNTVFAGTVEGARMVGGIIGNSDINNNKDGVSTTLNISNTLMIGSVKGNSATAGIVGRSENGQTVLTNVIVAGSVTSDKGAAFLGDGKVNVTLKNCYYAEEMAKMASAVGEVSGGTVVKASELTNKAVFDGWTKLNGTYPMPGSVAKMVNLSGNGDTSDFSAVSAIVIAMIALVASAAVVLSAKKRNA